MLDRILGRPSIIARVFGRASILRRSLGLGAFFLALAGGVLAIWAVVGSSASLLLRAIHAIAGIGAILAGRRIYRHSQALVFPRTRMNVAAILCVATGAFLFVAGLGLPGILVLAAGLLGLLGAAA